MRLNIFVFFSLFKFIIINIFKLFPATNPGKHTATNVRLSHTQDSTASQLACKRHFYDLLCKHFWEQGHTGKSYARENLMFKSS